MIHVEQPKMLKFGMESEAVLSFYLNYNLGPANLVSLVYIFDVNKMEALLI